MKIKKIEVYEIDELSNEIQQKVINSYRYLLKDSQEYNNLIIHFKMDLENIHFKVNEIILNTNFEKNDYWFTVNIEINNDSLECLKEFPNIYNKILENFRYFSNIRFFFNYKKEICYNVSTDEFENYLEPNFDFILKKKFKVKSKETEMIHICEKIIHLFNRIVKKIIDKYESETYDLNSNNSIIIREIKRRNYEFLENGDLYVPPKI